MIKTKQSFALVGYARDLGDDPYCYGVHKALDETPEQKSTFDSPKHDIVDLFDENLVKGVKYQIEITITRL